MLRMARAPDGSLVIRNTRREDGGNYTCTINGNKGHILESITHRLVVQGIYCLKIIIILNLIGILVFLLY